MDILHIEKDLISQLKDFKNGVLPTNEDQGNRNLGINRAIVLGDANHSKMERIFKGSSINKKKNINDKAEKFVSVKGAASLPFNKIIEVS